MEEHMAPVTARAKGAGGERNASTADFQSSIVPLASQFRLLMLVCKTESRVREGACSQRMVSPPVRDDDWFIYNGAMSLLLFLI